MNSKNIHSLSEFLLHAGTDYRIFDLGRGVFPVSSQDFLDIENGKVCPPRPRQQHVWYAVVFWQTRPKAQRYIWFVKFPVDEQGMLVQAARNHFLQIIVDALGHQIAADQAADELPDNPYTFTPTQQQMAQFSAITRQALGDPKNDAAPLVEQYLQTPAVIDWQKLPVQAIADTLIAMNDTLAEHIVNHYEHFSEPFIDTMLSSLESVELNSQLRDFFIQQTLEHAREDSQHQRVSELLRALSSPVFSAPVNACINQLFDIVAQPDMHLLSVIAARHYAQLDTLTAQRFLEAAAKADQAGAHQHALFIGLFSDLVQIPVLRRTMLTLAKAHQHNPVMQQSVAALFNQAGSAQ
ncbi:DUF3549 family protein [Alteromonas gilva]|uniref:DUF3549 family protein n=1 Tax=Alteromonas gilva TaxID=2987522 RepID=A0ABT5L1V0_9ALTE|nr:DUF3549 family protein [Alteromonas gilva]MDC8830394.1 DUF3549 family protein [Alteromonas gilva]